MRRCIEINDPDDPRIATYRNIRERDLVGRQELFVAEGKVVLNVLLGARRFQTESVLVSENRLAGMRQTLQHLPPGTPLYIASRSVMDRIVGFPIHRGILGIGRRREPESLADLLASAPRQSNIIILSGIANHDNVGSIFRNAAALGADAVILDGLCCDPLYRKAIRVSVGAVLKVPFVRSGTVQEIMARVSNAGYRMLAFTPGAARDLVDLRPHDRNALVFGSEGHGLSPNLIEAMEAVRIAMAPGFDSLNVAAASAIALHHLRHPAME